MSLNSPAAPGTTLAKRPPVVPASGLLGFDAWLSCAGSGELAPEVVGGRILCESRGHGRFFGGPRADFWKMCLLSNGASTGLMVVGESRLESKPRLGPARR
jgi:hypothetical protein